MSMVQPLPFTPGAVLDVVWPWADWLGADTISAYTVTPGPGVTVNSDSLSGADVTAWITVAADQPVGAGLWVRCAITTAAGRTDARLIRLITRLRGQG